VDSVHVEDDSVELAASSGGKHVLPVGGGVNTLTGAPDGANEGKR
jgi:hypothetical protein